MFHMSAKRYEGRTEPRACEIIISMKIVVSVKWAAACLKVPHHVPIFGAFFISDSMSRASPE